MSTLLSELQLFGTTTSDNCVGEPNRFRVIEGLETFTPESAPVA